MSNSELPERASLEYLKKLAKDKLHELRQIDPHAKLANALLEVARDHGFTSWRALKLEVESREKENATIFFETCAKGDVEALHIFLANNPNLVHMDNPKAPHRGWTALHTVAQHGYTEAVKLLLKNGANPNTREAGDNTYPLHWAVASGHIDAARALLDAGGDVNGFGDVHELDVIGWATFYYKAGDADMKDVVTLLLERGAHHHIFSAIVVGDLNLIQKVVEQNPEALDHRTSRYDQGQTPLHFAIGRHRYDILDLLIDLGADLEAEDKNGHTAMAEAMLRGDQQATERLQKAGAKQPKPAERSNFIALMTELANSVRHSAPMINVPDVAKTIDWYKSIGFKEIGRNEEDGIVNWGALSFGKADLMLSVNGKAGPHDVTLWFYTDQVDKLYELLKSKQLEVAQVALAEKSPNSQQIEFVQHIYNPFYGGREFGIRDLNGYTLFFRQPPE